MTRAKLQGGQIRDDHNFFPCYLARLKAASAMACIMVVLYRSSSFLSKCGLLWAPSVVLGALSSKHDYFAVIALLLLDQIVQLSIVETIRGIMAWKPGDGIIEQKYCIYEYGAAALPPPAARIIDQALQFAIIGARILISARGLQNLGSSVKDPESKFNGLMTSLCIFYALVLVNGIISGIAVVFSKHVVPQFVDTMCLRKYYEKVVSTGMDEGLLHATNFDLLSWIFQMQADEYRRNQSAQVVKDLYGDSMKFLYYHPKDKGFEATKVALAADDTYKREAAANIVALWVQLVDVEEKLSDLAGRGRESQDLETGQISRQSKNPYSRLLTQTKLFAKLAEALKDDESGRAASVSFHTLVLRDPEGMLEVRSEGGNEMLTDILMDRIHKWVKREEPEKAITDIKVMIPLLPSLLTDKLNGHEPCKYCTQQKLDVLKKDLHIIVTECARNSKGLQAVAAYAYYRLTSEEERRGLINLCALLLVEPEEKDSEYILKDEVECLLKVLNSTDTLQPTVDKKLPDEWNSKVQIPPDQDDTKKLALPWLARDRTALVADYVFATIFVLCAFLIMGL